MKKHVFLLSVWLMAFLSISSCADGGRDEVARIKSPDGLVEAVVVSLAVNATASNSVEVYLVPAGQSWRNEKPVTKGDRFEEQKIRWLNPKLLEIEYQKGRIFSYTNFWNSEKIHDFNYIVEIRLAPKSTPSLPDY